MNNLAKVIALGGRRLNKAVAMHYLFAEQGTKGYIPLAYIESTGMQYIDTGIKPSDDMVFEIEYQVMEDADSGRKLFGCEVGGSSMFNAFKVKKASAAIRAFAGNGVGENGVVTAINTNADQKTELKVEIKDGKYTVSVDDVSYPQVAANGTVPELNIYLFAVNRLRGGTTFADAPISARIYSCKIYKSGALVGDFRPYLNADGEAGMYNTVDRKFHKNLGTGEFIAGRSIDKYVHDSANLFLDGIWNAGEGVHSDTLTSWVDLSGNCQPTPLGIGNTVGENCITSDGTGNGRMTVPDFDPINLDTFTLEVLFKRNGNVDANQVIIGRAYTKSYYLNTYSNNLTVWLGGKQNNLNNVINETDKFLVQITHTGSSFSVWLDGVKVISDKLNTILADTSRLNLFGYSGNKTTFMGSIFAMRLHNRVLTDAELAQNYEVDKARFDIRKIYGVSWDGTSATAFSRTDDAELFTNPIPYVAGATSYGSPFDNISPWKDMQIVEDATAGKLVKIPKYYYKWTKSGDTMKLQISAEPFEGSLVSPAHADRGDGKGERDVVYVGRYHCNSSYKSVTGSNPVASITRATARANIHNLGSSYWQYDFAMYWTIAMLYLVEFADWNSQAKIGYGCSPSDSKWSVGYTDSMPYHTGTTASARTSYGGTQYRNIEGLWDNVFDWCDGIYFNGANVYCIKNPSSFSDSSGGTLVGTRPTGSGWISAFDVPTADGFEYALYTSAISGSNATYITDYCSSSGVVLFVGGYYSQAQRYGLFYLDGYSPASSTSSIVGSRLQKLP